MKKAKETPRMSKLVTLGQNLAFLRNHHNYSQEAVAEKIQVSRQAVAKWESGESLPDIMNCEALASLFNVSLDALLHHDSQEEGTSIAPKGKHMFGVTEVGEKGQIALPKEARKVMGINKGDTLVVLGDESLDSFGIALVPSEYFLGFAQKVIQSKLTQVIHEDTEV